MLKAMTLPREQLLSNLLGALPALREAAWSYALELAGRHAWLVGGVVRDLALGLQPLDIDLALTGDSFGVAQRLARLLGGRFVPLHDEFGSCRVILPDGRQLDLTDLQGDSLEADLARRDLTINAIAVPWPAGDEVIDPTDGLNDLANGIARRPTPGVIGVDPVRVLRVLRFAAAFDLTINSGTADELHGEAPRLATMPGERVWIELRALLAQEPGARWIDALDRFGVLDALFPELADCAGVEQPLQHHLDVRAHSLETACQLDNLWADPVLAPSTVPPLARALTRLAALLHDIGKPAAAAQAAGSGAIFPKHQTIGAARAEHICRRLRLSRDERTRVAALVGAHMRPPQLADLLAAGELTARATRRFLLDLGDDWPLCLALARADLRATAGPAAPPDGEVRSQALARHLREAAESRLAPTLAQPLVTGHDVMDLGVAAGPELGRLLDAVAQAQFENPALTRDEALALLRTLIANPPPTADEPLGKQHST